MRILVKFALLPVIVAITSAWLLAALASRLFGLFHGFLWALILIPVIVACCLQMWQNAVIFLAVGVVSYLVLLGLTVVEVLLKTVRHGIVSL